MGEQTHTHKQTKEGGEGPAWLSSKRLKPNSSPPESSANSLTGERGVEGRLRRD